MAGPPLSGDHEGCAAGIIRLHAQISVLELVHIDQELGVVARFLEVCGEQLHRLDWRQRVCDEHPRDHMAHAADV